LAKKEQHFIFEIFRKGEMCLKVIDTGGILNIHPLDNCPEWYWGTDYSCGDLYEAEEVFRCI